MAQRRASKADSGRLEEVSEAESSDWEIDNPQEEVGAPRHRKKVMVAEKDAEEADLERLVLGDKAGFRTLLFQSSAVEDAEDYLKDLSLAVVPADEDDTGMAELDDNNMFFTDEGMVHSAMTDVAVRKSAGGGESQADAHAAAWEDSDDERLRVSLAGHTRLRKLRRFEGEDIVSGTVYSERLRQQYLRLNPQPEWAVDAEKARIRRESKAAAAALKKKKNHQRRKSGDRRTSDDSGLSNSEDDDDDDDEDDDDGFGEAGDALPLDMFFRSAGSLAGASSSSYSGGQQRKRRRLQPETLGIQKTRDMATVHVGPVDSLAFHPRFAVLLSASTSSVLHLHQVAPGAQPVANPLLTSVRVRQLPVRRAAFLGADGGRVVFAGRRRFFHTWDLASGQVQRVSRVQGHQLEQRTMERFRASTGSGDDDHDGHLAFIATDRKGGGMLNILSVQTMQWEAQARLDSRGGIADFQWWRDGAGITILGRDGGVGEWCLATRRFVGLWRDDGSTGGTTLGLGGSGGPDILGGDRWVAIGSKSGVVNIYDRRALLLETSSPSGGDASAIVATPAPARCFEQLTTPVTQVVFSPDGQLLVFASRFKTDALRIAHLPSCTVYRNWPTQQTPLGRITALAFSKDSDLLAVGNDVGKTRLWEIRD